ncbi:MAG: hypothetical protein ACTSQY_05330 [Candidatus Odinarchaeia archaeon]
MEIINEARELRSKNIYHSLSLYRKGINILLKERKFDQAVNSLLEYANLISTLRGILGFDEVLTDAAQKFERFEQFKEAGEIYITIANLYYRFKLYGEAAFFYEKAGNNLVKVNVEDSSKVASACFAKASECYELTSMRRKAEGILKKSVFALSDRNILDIEEKAFKLLDERKFEESAKKFHEIASVYEKALDNLKNIVETSTDGGLALSVKCILTEYSAIYSLLAAICFMSSGYPSEKVKEISLDAANFFKKAFVNYEGVLSPAPKRRSYYLHAAYNLMWALIIYSKYGLMDSVKELSDELEHIPQRVKEKIRKNEYYQISEEILDRGVDIISKRISEIYLGKLEKVSDKIANYISE